MRSLNIVQVEGTLSKPVLLNRASARAVVYANTRLSWQAGGRLHHLPVSAVGETAMGMYHNLTEGEALLITGRLSQRPYVQLKVSSVQRLALPQQVTQVDGYHALIDAESHFTLHGHAAEDSRALAEGGFVTTLALKDAPTPQQPDPKPTYLLLHTHTPAQAGDALVASGPLRPGDNGLSEALSGPNLIAPDYFRVTTPIIRHALDIQEP